MKTGICNNNYNNENIKGNTLDIINKLFNDGSLDKLLDEVLSKGTDITINDKENKIIYQFVSSDSKNKTSNISSIDL